MGRKKWVPLYTPFKRSKTPRYPSTSGIRSVSKCCGRFPKDCLTCHGGYCIVPDRDKISRHS